LLSARLGLRLRLPRFLGLRARLHFLRRLGERLAGLPSKVTSAGTGAPDGRAANEPEGGLRRGRGRYDSRNITHLRVAVATRALLTLSDVGKARAIRRNS
jgi:hypothetical protein